MKDLYIAAHEALISEMMDADPSLTWAEAYELCADAAYDRMVDRLADRADSLRQRAKESRYE